MAKQKGKKNEFTSDYLIREAMNLLSGKWTITVINNLMTGKKRFKELERSIEGINTRMLTKTLRELEAMNIVTRKGYPTTPPTVEYSLTTQGLALQPVIRELQGWAYENLQRIDLCLTKEELMHIL